MREQLTVIRDKLYWWKLRLLSCFGKYRCPVCSRRICEFWPLPAMYREKAAQYGAKPGRIETCNEEAYTCPFCGASDRDRLIALFLGQFFKERIEQKAPLRIVDFAPSKPLSAYIRRRIATDLTGSEYRTADLYMSGTDDKVDLMDMRQYRDDSFDVYICSHVLEHVPDDRKALGELFRITRKGGIGILLGPLDLNRTETDEDPSVVDAGERWRRFGQDDHVRAYAKADFLTRTTDAGFTVREFREQDCGFNVFSRVGVMSGSLLYIADK